MNPELIEQTVRDYSGKLLKIAYTYTKNTCDAEDIVQEVFLSFITSRQEFASQEHIRCRGRALNLWKEETIREV